MNTKWNFNLFRVVMIYLSGILLGASIIILVDNISKNESIGFSIILLIASALISISFF